LPVASILFLRTTAMTQSPTSSVSVADIRKTFLDFFASKGHTVVASSALVPGNDPTLMFTNSGMVQFKDVFLGAEKRSYVRATSVQACLRAGGKHNDLENVGYTARHHTFFEMLGNWSFGDYFKRESLHWGWELLTQVYKLPPERLLVTVYIDDDEAYDIWHKEIGLPADRIVRIGDNKGKKYASDNFWMMADTGPCGPCSEIFYDHGPHIPGGPPGSPEEDGDRFIEIWNHVFMQFDMQTDGSLVKLPAPCVDTGMGLERLAAILQHVHSNYEIDIFDQLIQAAARETGCSDLKNNSLRVIADHIRAATFLIADGVMPSNEGRGYVLRRIIRRAIRHQWKVGQLSIDGVFWRLVQPLSDLMGEAYPAIREKKSFIEQCLKGEEAGFVRTLDDGMTRLEGFLHQQNGKITGAQLFQLHDTYGCPPDLIGDIFKERALGELPSDVLAEYQSHMEQQKSQARAAGKFKQDRALDYAGAGNVFVGYDHLAQTAVVEALYLDGVPVRELHAGQSGVVVLDVTPFYAESGGQVGDEGTLSSGSSVFAVMDTQKIKSDVFGHHGSVSHGSLKVGDTVQAQVNIAVRAAAMRNHSATHLMHEALREVLGEHVQQKGSLVNAERTRFDFAHNAPVTDAQIRAIEDKVNAQILTNSATQAQLMDIESAKKTGAQMLFGEKYGEIVRVLDIGSTRELCGGTHVGRTGDIGVFKIVSEGGIASGVRRIEAVTGSGALAYWQDLEDTVAQAAAALKTPVAELRTRIASTVDHAKAQDKEIATLKAKLAAYQGEALISQVQDLSGVPFLAARMEGADAAALRSTLQKLRDKLPRAIIVLGAVEGDKVQLVAGVSAELIAKVKAGELVNFLAAQVGGKGGGKPDMAMAGGTDPSKLDAAIASARAWVAAKL
jgi:alanyl-tRNA synthetase